MIQTFIVCHDPRVIDHYEKNGHYSYLSNYKYILVGQADYAESDKVIIARNLPVNIEDKKNLLVYTAWYAIIENNLASEKYVRLLEYDTIISDDIESRSITMIHQKESNIGVWGHFPYHMNSYHFIQNPEWIESLDIAMKQVYNTSIQDLVQNSNKILDRWMGTSNILFKIEEMKAFVEWYKPLAELVYQDPKAGHGLERALTFFCLHQNKPYHFIENALQHYQLNSHGTQQAGDYEENVKKILWKN
jgi:hypothetical protein